MKKIKAIKQLNVLGTDYKIIVKKYNEEAYFKRENSIGFCDGYKKEIVLCDMTTYEGWEHETKETICLYQKHMLRHEIVHAFLNESGLKNSASQHNYAWSKNEEMIDWFALQGPKIYVAWKEVDAL